MIDFSKTIYELRQAMCLNQNDFGQKLGVTSVTVCRWETGKFRPSMKERRKLMAMFKKAKLIKEGDFYEQ
jgi:Predicted transcriptional regulators